MPYLLADTILVNGPHGGHVGGQQLVLGQRGVARPGADQASLPHRVVAHNHTLDGFNVGSFVVHVSVHL